MWPGSSPSALVNGAAGMIVAALLVTALYAGRDLLIPLALAGLFSFVLAPLVRRLVSWRLPHGVAVAVVLAALLAIAFGGITLASRQVTQLLEDLPRHEVNLRNKARYLQLEFGASGVWQRAAATMRRIEDEVRNPQSDDKSVKFEVAQGSESGLSTLFEYTRASIPSLLTAGLALLFTLFILLQYRDLRDRAVRLMGAAEIGRSTQAFNEAGDDLADYLLLQSILNAGFGVFVGIALWAIGVPGPVLWGAFAAVMRFVPYFGSFLAAVFPIALAAMIDEGWWMVLETTAVFVIGEPLLGQIVEPLVFGSHTRLSPLAVLFGVAFWTALWGPVGLVLAVPLTLAIVVMGQHVPHLDFLRILLGNEPALQPHERHYHQLLAGDAGPLAKEAEAWIAERTFGSYLNEVAIPSLAIASDDQRRGVLGREQMNELKETIAEYMRHVKESLEFKREQDAARAAGNPVRRAANVLVIAGRGSLDVAAAELAADAVRLDLGISARCPSSGGLTAISAAAAAAGDEPEIVALVSVGGVTPPQLELLIRRARLSFPDARLVIGYWDKRGGFAPAPVGGPRYADSPTALVELIGRRVDERPQQSVPLLEVKDTA